MWINPENERRGVAVEHRHSYWLKYLLLKFIDRCENDGKTAKSKLVVDYFVDTTGHPAEFIKLCLGSLCAASESHCVVVKGSIEQNMGDRELRLTDRGKTLVKGTSGGRTAYCFDLSYLQLVIDDFWMAIPCNYFNEVFVDANLSYSFALRENYISGIGNYLSKKLYAAFTFFRILESSWEYEASFSTNKESLNSFKPDFSAIFRSLEIVASNILSTFPEKKIRTRSGIIIDSESVGRKILQLKNDKTFDAFWNNVKVANATVELSND